VLELLFVPPRPTNMMHISDARVSAMGTKMHANLPALPILRMRYENAKR